MSQGDNAKREGARSHELYVLKALNRVSEGNQTLIDALVPGQSSILSFGSGQTGTLTGFSCYEIYNSGTTDILIDGVAVSAGLAFHWEGDFSYDTQSSSLFVITFD
jgi:hypothetical protein